jgi:polyhydroxyalkanoate synthase
VHLVANAEVTFALTSGGHNAGIVSEPGHPRRSYRIATRRPGEPLIEAEEWEARVPRKEGSWWPEWQAWLAARSTPGAEPPPMGAPERGLPPLVDAPGAYVLQR